MYSSTSPLIYSQSFPLLFSIVIVTVKYIIRSPGVKPRAVIKLNSRMYRYYYVFMRDGMPSLQMGMG